MTVDHDVTTRPAGDLGPVRTVKRMSGTNAGIGVWLVLAPFILGYSALQGPLWNDLTCGVLIAVLGLIRFGSPLGGVWASWTNAGIGAWLVIAPFVLDGYVVPATWNDIVCGLLVVILAVASAQATPRGTARI